MGSRRARPWPGSRGAHRLAVPAPRVKGRERARIRRSGPPSRRAITNGHDPGKNPPKTVRSDNATARNACDSDRLKSRTETMSVKTARGKQIHQIDAQTTVAMVTVASGRCVRQTVRATENHAAFAIANFRESTSLNAISPQGRVKQRFSQLSWGGHVRPHSFASMSSELHPSALPPR